MSQLTGYMVSPAKPQGQVRRPHVLFGIETSGASVFNAPVEVMCSIDNVDDYTLRYTVDGTAPTAGSDEYEGPITLYATRTLTVRPVLRETGWLGPMKIVEFVLSIPVTFSQPGGRFYDLISLELTAPSSDYEIRYITDGPGDPMGGAVYAGPIEIAGHAHVSAVAVYGGVQAGPVATEIYTLILFIAAFTDVVWRDSQGVLDVPTNCAWSKLSGMDTVSGLTWDATVSADALSLLSWSRISHADALMDMGWDAVTCADSVLALAWAEVATRDVMLSVLWNGVESGDVITALDWTRTDAVDIMAGVPWGRMTPLDFALSLNWGKLDAVDRLPGIPWSRMTPCDVLSWTAYATGVGTAVEERLGSFTYLPWIAAARMIMTKQIVTFVRVADAEPVRILSGSFGTDEDSVDYTFSAVVASREDLDKVRPGATSGGEVEVELTINGYAARFMVTAYTENKGWGRGTYSITGRSPSCVLGQGYSAPETAVFNATTAEQIVADMLNGTGWAYGWGLATNTWPINGEFSVVDKTKLEIISEIARAVGGIVQTDPVNRMIFLKKRHPVSPKNYAGVTPDEYILTGVLTENAQWQAAPKYNQVMVSGKETGVFVIVRRENTAGDIPAPDIIDPLLTAQALNIERGREFLDANGYDRQRVTLELPLPASGSGQRPKMLYPCELVEVDDGREVWRGRVSSAEIGFDRAKTRQRIQVERYYV